MDLAPTSDDIWLYWMHSLNSSNIRTLGAKKIITWFQSQEISLWTDNGGELQLNDIAIQNMMKEYGFAQLNN